MLTTKLMRKRATLEDIYKLYLVCTRIPSMLSTLKDTENTTIKSVLYDPLKDVLNDLTMFKQMVDQILDMDGVDDGRFNVKSEFDEKLKVLKDKLDNLEDKMNRLLKKAMQDLELKDIKLDYVSHIGYHFRITLANEKELRQNTQKYKIIDTVKGCVRFSTNSLSDLNSDYTEVRDEYEEQQKTIVSEVLRIAIGYMIPFTSLNHILAQIDVLGSFAMAACNAPVQYVRPIILPEGSGRLKMKNVRHPCLELQEGVTYIANDVDFEKDGTNMKIITGPNCGGKSTYIRSAGVSVLLAHIGSFVPCEKAEIPIVDAILGRVGADDNLGKGLSTFMVEMIETAGIIRVRKIKFL